MYRVVLKIVGILTVIGAVWWRMEGSPLPGFLSGNDDQPSAELVFGPDGRVDMSRIAGREVDSPAEAASIVYSLLGEVMDRTQEAAEIAALRQQRGCSFSTLPDMSDCPDPATVSAPPPQDGAEPAPTVVTGRERAEDASGVVVFRPSR